MSELLERLQRTFDGVYRIERELGGGGMSRVFVATEVALKRSVVIKVLSPELVSPVMTARFVREFEVTALLQHPHILPVLAAGERDGLLFFVTPFIEGESLRHRLDREKQLPVRDAVRILGELSSALAYAHERGVVHRDIKPENVLLSNGLAVLADFGIAAALASEPTSPAAGGATRLTAVGTSVGTAGYMSPEQVAGDPNVDGRSDLYSLAVVGYELFAGAPPFVRPTAIATMTAHLTEQAPLVSVARPETPAAVSAALAKALEKDPAARFQTAREFGDALGISFTGETSSRPTPAAPRARRTRLLVGGGVAAVAIAAAALWAMTRSGSTTLDENLVVIAPFDVLDPSLQMWREGMVDILATNLDGAGPLRTVPPTLVVRRWSGRPDKVSATELGKQTGARVAVFGRMVGAGADSVRLTASVLDVAAGRTLGDIELREGTQRMDRLADSLTIRILAELNQTRAITSVRQASLGSTSLPGLKAYLQGEQHYRRSDWDSASVYYKRAIETDSMFAPALRRLSNALAWNLSNGEPGAATTAYRYALLAGQRNRGLAPRESLLVAADSLAAALNLRNETGNVNVVTVARRLIATLEEGTRRWPNDPEIWHRLGDIRFHYLFFVPNGRYADARRAFDRSIELDSAFAPSYIHMPELALRGQDPDGARRYIRLYLAVNREDNFAAQGMRMTERMLDGSPAALRSLDSTLNKGGLQLGGQAISGIIMWMDSAETGVKLMRIADSVARVTPSIPDVARRQIRASLVSVLATRGRLAEAAALVDASTWTIAPELAMLGALPGSRVDSLVAGVLFGPQSGYWQIPAAYRWWAQQGDTVRLQRAMAAMQKLSPQLASPPEMASLRAHIAMAKRDTATAIREFAMLSDSLCVVNFCYQYRLAKAQLLSAKRLDREAELLLSQEFAPQGPSHVLWMLERGRVFERLGKRNEAVDAYAYVSSAWIRADSVLQPAVREARAGLGRLSPDRR